MAAGKALDLVTAGCICADVMARPVDAMPAHGTLGLIEHLDLQLGGLAGVTAAVFSRMGGRAGFTGRIGTDAFGDIQLAILKGHGVDVSCVHRKTDEGSSASVVLISGDGERTILHHTGVNATVCEDDLDFDYIGGAAIFHWGGPGLTPKLEGEAMARIFQRVRAAGGMTAMDTCYDGKGVWGPLIAPALPHLDIAMTSMAEAAYYTGCETPEQIARHFLDAGAKRALVKLGADGVYAAEGEHAVHVPGHVVDAVDTTGAGDAACAGFLYGCAKGESLERSARLANAVGAMTVVCVGGANGVASLEAVETFMKVTPCGV